MEIVSIIPARGGSKGIKKKNLIDLNGKPLLSYGVNASLSSKVNKTYVCSEDDEIIQEADKLGCNYLKRPNYLATDEAKTEPTLIYFSTKVKFDILVFIQATSPLITSKIINEGIHVLIQENYDSVFTVHEEHWLPRWDENINPLGWKTSNSPRRQDIKPSFVENGMMYITKRESLVKSKLRYSGKVGFIKIPLLKSFQVDSNEDLTLIKKIMEDV